MRSVVEKYDELSEKAFVIKNRVRDGGKNVQRKKRVSGRKGFTYDNNKKKAVKLNPAERKKMSIKSKLGAKKAKSKKSQAAFKRNKSNNKRKSLGFNK